MKIYSARLVLASLLLLTHIIPNVHAMNNNPPVEDIEALLKSTRSGGILDTVDSAYVRHPVLCTAGFSIIAFIVLYCTSAEIRKRVRTFIGIHDDHVDQELDLRKDVNLQ